MDALQKDLNEKEKQLGTLRQRFDILRTEEFTSLKRLEDTTRNMKNDLK